MGKMDCGLVWLKVERDSKISYAETGVIDIETMIICHCCSKHTNPCPTPSEKRIETRALRTY